MNKNLIEFSDYITIVLVFLVLPVTGFLLLFAGEIFLLGKKKWVDEKQRVRYPLITFLINIPVVIVAIFVLNIGERLKDTSADRFLDSNLSATASLVAYSFMVGLVLFSLLLIIFFLIRLATTSFLMAASAKLTWAYITGQAALLAAVLSIVHPLGQIISVLFLEGMEFY